MYREKFYLFINSMKHYRIRDFRRFKVYASSDYDFHFNVFISNNARILLVELDDFVIIPVALWASPL